MLCKVKIPILRGNISNLENDDLKSGNNLLDRLKCLFDTSAEVCELILTRYCSSKENSDEYIITY